ncbi:MAG TPA: alpha/beta hydrolase [Myxococcaceae bacterium]|nr:alpha/beta hydrolase [Myxococcaceae bacterium]
MREAAFPPPRLVPSLEEVQHGYELPCEHRRVRGAMVRLFTFPEGSQEPSHTVLCLPGLGASGRSFAPMRPLAPDFRLLLWTPPLHTPMTHTPLQWNLSSLEHPDARLPERLSLLGSSFGSLLALAFAVAHPERVNSLVLVSPVASVHRVRRWALALSTLVRVPKPFAYVLAPAVARVLGGSHLPPEGRAEIVREARRLSPVELLRRLEDILAVDYLDELERLPVPTLVLHGARDMLVPLSYARDVAERLPRGRLEVIREASHLPYMSHTDAFNAFVGDFLQQHTRGVR